MRVCSIRSAICVLGFLVIGTPLSFQGNAQENSETQVKSREIQDLTAPGTGTAAGAWEDDEDFGKIEVLKLARPWSVTLQTSVRGFWTSNALLARKGEKGDTIFVESQGLTSSYRLTRDWRVEAGYSFDLTRYDENPLLDTDAQSAYFSTSFQFPYDWQLGAGVRGLWMTSPHQNVEVYRECAPYGSLVHSHDFLDDRLTWFYGYQFDHRFTHPVGFERDEHTIFTGASYSWRPDLLSQMVLRQNWQFYDFRPPSQPVNGRQEWTSTVGLQTIWQPLSWLQVSSFAMVSYDNSENASRDYKAANLGGEIRAFWKF